MAQLIGGARQKARLKAASTLPEDARLAPFAKFLLQTTKLHAESVAHTSPGLRLRRNPREAPTRNSTLKACHIADTKDNFHCQATENGQLSIGDRLPRKMASTARQQKTANYQWVTAYKCRPQPSH
ncbi:MAG: hypothetical protein ACOX9E_08460 [Lentisphaeria bacterium]